MDWLLGAIKDVAVETPAAVAVVEDGQVLSYSSLEFASDEFALELARQSQVCGSGSVAYLGSTGIDLVIALIAAHKAAVPFVALDPRFPDEALRKMALQVDAFQQGVRVCGELLMCKNSRSFREVSSTPILSKALTIIKIIAISRRKLSKALSI